MSNKFEFTNSSSLLACDYDDEKQILIIIFIKGKEYNYLDVPKQVYEDLKASDSPGKFFMSNIRNNYVATQI